MQEADTRHIELAPNTIPVLEEFFKEKMKRNAVKFNPHNISGNSIGGVGLFYGAEKEE
ncbi:MULTISPECIES: hypothetical protein [unclassified Leptolyngbya]|uniref:hypothetical protein n=1 Tax=unclassified Leptolyngbya TaxID=2650499 RepID=UPI001688D8E5|nr:MULTISPECIES: hypothetical protein [unclassified Leptolyngbya]MBD1909657.1 hypothetical protein [Leptolyngbya sp. FACHB-8]MBD2157566.1 hypothetical protein [Leptolyngbya sp. FACHB-16]